MSWQLYGHKVFESPEERKAFFEKWKIAVKQLEATGGYCDDETGKQVTVPDLEKANG